MFKFVVYSILFVSLAFSLAKSDDDNDNDDDVTLIAEKANDSSSLLPVSSESNYDDNEDTSQNSNTNNNSDKAKRNLHMWPFHMKSREQFMKKLAFQRMLEKKLRSSSDFW